MKGKEDQSILLCRARFTEKEEKRELEKGKSGSKPDPKNKKEEHLWRLRENEIIPGTATIALMMKFREFPRTQDTMLTVGRRDQILIGYLAENLLIEGAVLKRWQDNQESALESIFFSQGMIRFTQTPKKSAPTANF